DYSSKMPLWTDGPECFSERLSNFRQFILAESVIQPTKGKGFSGLSISLVAKEVLQNRCAFVLENARGDFAAVIEGVVLQQIHDCPAGPGPRISAAKNYPANSSVNDCPGAHRAGFLGHVNIAVRQAPIAHGCFCLG